MSDMQDWNFWEMLERSLPFIGVSVTGGKDEGGKEQ